MPRLVINPGTPQEWEIQLKQGANTLGRSAECDFQVEHGSVSGAHCRLTVENGIVKLRDLGSTNGTFLERAPVHEASLRSGQRLQIGSVEIQFLDDGTAALAALPESPSPDAPRVALRVSLPSAPMEEAPPPPPAAYLPDEYDVAPAGPVPCKHHPKSPARWMCTHCQLGYCELCVASRPGGTRGGRFCRRCSQECVPVQVQLVDPGAGKRNFFATMPGAFLYPLKGAGIWFVLVGALFYGFLVVMGYVARYSMYGAGLILVRVIYAGYAIAFLQRVLQTAAQGDDDPPSWPDFSEFWQDIILPFLQAVALFAVCFGPALALAIQTGISAVTSGTAEPLYLILVGLLALGGAAYFPMATLAVAMADTVMAMNPLVVIPAIFKTPLQYVLILVLTGLIFAFWFAANVGFALLLPIPIVPEAIIGGVMFYLLIVWARALGLMYFATKDRLAWFNR